MRYVWLLERNPLNSLLIDDSARFLDRSDGVTDDVSLAREFFSRGRAEHYAQLFAARFPEITKNSNTFHAAVPYHKVSSLVRGTITVTTTDEGTKSDE